MKKFSAWFFVLLLNAAVLLCAVSPCAFAWDGKPVRITGSSGTVKGGSTIEFFVDVSFDSSITSFDMTLEYNSSLITMQTAKKGSAVSGGSVMINPSRSSEITATTRNKIKMSYANSTPMSNNGSLIEVSFLAVEGKSGAATVRIKFDNLTGEDDDGKTFNLPSVITNGSIQVTATSTKATTKATTKAPTPPSGTVVSVTTTAPGEESTTAPAQEPTAETQVPSTTVPESTTAAPLTVPTDYTFPADFSMPSGYTLPAALTNLTAATTTTQTTINPWMTTTQPLAPETDDDGETFPPRTLYTGTGIFITDENGEQTILEDEFTITDSRKVIMIALFALAAIGAVVAVFKLK